MPKYNVSEVLDIIKSLTEEEKRDLQIRLSEILTSDVSTNQPSQRQSQNFGNVNISGSSIAADFGQKQAIGGSITSPQNVIQSEGNNLQYALSLLADLKQSIMSNNNLSLLQKATTEAQVNVI